jgi:hypothetical protein
MQAVFPVRSSSNPALARLLSSSAPQADTAKRARPVRRDKLDMSIARSSFRHTLLLRTFPNRSAGGQAPSTVVSRYTLITSTAAAWLRGPIA